MGCGLGTAGLFDLYDLLQALNKAQMETSSRSGTGRVRTAFAMRSSLAEGFK
jgi:hypothetical protein